LGGGPIYKPPKAHALSSTGRLDAAKEIEMLQRPTKLIRQITSQASAEKVVKELFAEAGITVNGSAEHDITVHDERFYTRVLRDATLGMGESYMERWWDSPRLDETMSRLVKAELY